MKNLKRTLAVVIALTMIMSTVAFAAAFSDVEDTAAYAEAIEVGVALNLFTGYEDGTFKPSGDITRAEFSAIVVRMLAQDAQADGAKGSTKFTDVPSTHWAAGYINICSNMGIINGYGDGNFGPEDKVTYEQAVKMVIVALGYEPAVGSAGYPVGYLTIAQQRGVTNGVRGTNGVAINRGQVAQMAFNSLDVPIMEQTGFGTYVDYIVQDGLGDSAYRKTIMSEKLNIVKYRATVVEMLELSQSRKTGVIRTDILNNYKSKYGVNDTDDFYYNRNNATNYIDVNKGNTKLDALVGTRAIIYVLYDETSGDEPVAVYARKDVSNVDELTISSDSIEADNITVSAGGVVTVRYYPTESSTRTESLTIDNNASVYLNGMKVIRTVENALLPTSAPLYGSVTFSLQNSGSANNYDTVFITQYTNTVVDTVSTTTGRVTAKKGATVSFDENSDISTATLHDVDGNVVDWRTLKENDVLSVMRIIGTSGSQKTIYIATLVTKSITGAISETYGDLTDAKEAEFGIGGVRYKVDGQCAFPNELKLQDEGTFYLDIMGRISYFEVDSSVSNSYAYIIMAERFGNIDPRTQIKMFTYAGEMVTLDTAQNVTVQYTKAGEYKRETVKSLDLLSTTEAYKVGTDKFVTFGVNAQGQINRLSFPDTTIALGRTDTRNFSIFATGSADYDNQRQSFNIGGTRAYINSSSVVMVAPKVQLLTVGGEEGLYYADGVTRFNEDDYQLLKLSSLADDYEGWTNVTAYDANVNREAGVVFVGSQVNLTGDATGVAMIISAATVRNNSNDTVTKLNVLQNTNEANQFKARELTADRQWSASETEAAKVIIPMFNAKGEVYNYNLIASVVTGADNKKTVDLIGADTAKVKYTLDKVAERSGNRITTDSDKFFNIPASANVYVYDPRGGRAETRVFANFDRFDVFTVDRDPVTVGGVTTYKYRDAVNDRVLFESVYVLVREYDGNVADVIFYLLDSKDDPNYLD